VGVDEAKATARDAKDSTVVDRLARLGLAARGVVWLTIGLLALRIATGGGAQADRNGALRTIADKPFGKVLLVVLVVGFTGYAVWRLLEAATGHRDEDGAKRTGKRVASAARGLLYGGFAVSTVSFLLSGGGGDKTQPRTAQVMEHTGGRLLVGAVGVAVVVGGLVLAVRGVRTKFLDKLRGMPPLVRKVTVPVGAVGLAGRGLVIALVGGLLVDAAARFDPKKAKGLDGALKTLADQPFGKVLLGLAALGLLCFAAWSFLEARYRRI
jgi:Domain of Unknown Function (DUF1206)